MKEMLFLPLSMAFMATISAQTTPAVEITTFRLVAGADPEGFARASTQLNEGFLQAQPGFVHRILTVDEAGVWTDILFWESQDAAHQAMRASHENSAAGAYFQFINLDSVHFRLTEKRGEFSKL